MRPLDVVPERGLIPYDAGAFIGGRVGIALDRARRPAEKAVQLGSNCVPGRLPDLVAGAASLENLLTRSGIADRLGWMRQGREYQGGQQNPAPHRRLSFEFGGDLPPDGRPSRTLSRTTFTPLAGSLQSQLRENTTHRFGISMITVGLVKQEHARFLVNHKHR
ncbi:hypothetical protein BOSEA31B_13694 [Hyphomicrobiales bacterium]|nr:hypothetical protein BOSEA31B_13694 [Hyphomicrobiales bacterium]CAH1699465.1 hypothetical protein BOSEA1005_12519 [Hyphomicrobiales bacterium]